MVRSGIYVNGKEIVARYVGDKLVWPKWVELDFMINPTMNIINSTSLYLNNLYEIDFKKSNFNEISGCKVMCSGTYYNDVTVRQQYSATYDGRGFIHTMYLTFKSSNEYNRFKSQFSNLKKTNQTIVIEALKKE